MIHRIIAALAFSLLSMGVAAQASPSHAHDTPASELLAIIHGSKLVDLAGQTMTEVEESVRKVSHIVNEISAATHEQSIGLEEVNGAIVRMDAVTQQNAALVEQSAAAAQSMQDLAAQLSASVSVFKLEHSSLRLPA